MRLAMVCVATLFMAGMAMAQPAAGGGGGRGGGRGAGAGMFQQDPFQQTIAALGDLNLQPDFNLTKEQKEKLQGIRDDVKKAAAKWRTDNADALKKLQDDSREAMQGQDREKMREIMTKRQELMQTQPKTDDAAKQVTALLTEDQKAALEKKIAERREEMRNRGGMMGMGGGRRAGGGGGGGGGGQ